MFTNLYSPFAWGSMRYVSPLTIAYRMGRDLEESASMTSFMLEASVFSIA